MSGFNFENDQARLRLSGLPQEADQIGSATAFGDQALAATHAGLVGTADAGGANNQEPGSELAVRECGVVSRFATELDRLQAAGLFEKLIEPQPDGQVERSIMLGEDEIRLLVLARLAVSAILQGDVTLPESDREGLGSGGDRLNVAFLKTLTMPQTGESDEPVEAEIVDEVVLQDEPNASTENSSAAESSEESGNYGADLAVPDDGDVLTSANALGAVARLGQVAKGGGSFAARVGKSYLDRRRHEKLTHERQTARFLRHKRTVPPKVDYIQQSLYRDQRRREYPHMPAYANALADVYLAEAEEELRVFKYQWEELPRLYAEYPSMEGKLPDTPEPLLLSEAEAVILRTEIYKETLDATYAEAVVELERERRQRANDEYKYRVQRAFAVEYNPGVGNRMPDELRPNPLSEAEQIVIRIRATLPNFDRKSLNQMYAEGLEAIRGADIELAKALAIIGVEEREELIAQWDRDVLLLVNPGLASVIPPTVMPRRLSGARSLLIYRLNFEDRKDHTLAISAAAEAKRQRDREIAAWQRSTTETVDASSILDTMQEFNAGTALTLEEFLVLSSDSQAQIMDMYAQIKARAAIDPEYAASEEAMLAAARFREFLAVHLAQGEDPSGEIARRVSSARAAIARTATQGAGVDRTAIIITGPKMQNPGLTPIVVGLSERGYSRVLTRGRKYQRPTEQAIASEAEISVISSDSSKTEKGDVYVQGGDLISVAGELLGSVGEGSLLVIPGDDQHKFTRQIVGRELMSPSSPFFEAFEIIEGLGSGELRAQPESTSRLQLVPHARDAMVLRRRARSRSNAMAA